MPRNLVIRLLKNHLPQWPTDDKDLFPVRGWKWTVTKQGDVIAASSDKEETPIQKQDVFLTN